MQKSLDSFFRKRPAAEVQLEGSVSPSARRVAIASDAGVRSSSRESRTTETSPVRPAEAAEAPIAAAASAAPPSESAVQVQHDALDSADVGSATAGPLPPLSSGLVEPGWRRVLESEFRKPYFWRLCEFLESEARAGRTIYPPVEHLWTAFNACPADKVKVVILGQDPYHNPRQAHGLSFSVLPGVPVPPSLGNILRELASDLGVEVPRKSGCLLGWARQGVLLLNAVLTVRAGEANSHAGHGWETLTEAALRHVARARPCVVFMLWGKPAQQRVAALGNLSRHLVLTAAHPSPKSADRGFFGCRHFSRANAFLREHGQSPIDWLDRETP